MNKIKFTYDKFKTVKFGFSISSLFSQVLCKLFTFLIITTVKEIYNIYLSADRHTHAHTHKHTHTHTLSFNNIDLEYFGIHLCTKYGSITSSYDNFST